jgi:hypothetical protein
VAAKGSSIAVKMLIGTLLPSQPRPVCHQRSST